MIKSGKKIYELRLFDEKRKAIKVADQIEFTSVYSGEKLIVEVEDLLIFPSFFELYNSLSPLEIGYNECDSKTASHLDMQRYYSKEEQELFGVVAIKIKMIKNLIRRKKHSQIIDKLNEMQ